MGYKPPGAGRKPNTPNKFSRERAERAAKDGPLPHEALLADARNIRVVAAQYRPREVDETNKDGVAVKTLKFAPGHEERYVDLLQKAAAINKMAAPYYAPRMASVAITHRHVDLKTLTDDELDIMEKAAEIIESRNSSVGVDSDREGKTRH